MGDADYIASVWTLYDTLPKSRPQPTEELLFAHRVREIISSFSSSDGYDPNAPSQNVTEAAALLDGKINQIAL